MACVKKTQLYSGYANVLVKVNSRAKSKQQYYSDLYFFSTYRFIYIDEIVDVE